MTGMNKQEMILTHSLEALATEMRLLTGLLPYKGTISDLLATALINRDALRARLDLIDAVIAESGARVRKSAL